MTICIDLLCADAKQVVAVADRMISVEFLSLEFEQRTKKVEPLGQRFVALTAGDALAHTEILRDTVEAVSQASQPTVRYVASQIEKHFVAARQKLAEDTVLRRIGLDQETFFEQQRNLAPELVAGLLSEYQSVELDLEILLAGVDNSGAHLYQITDPGVTACFDSIGYAAIGSGLPHAEGFLTEANYSPTITMNRALWLCYVAKKRSERAPGVGKTYTDVLTIDFENGLRILDDKSVSELEAIYQKYRESYAEAEKVVRDSIETLRVTFEGESRDDG